MDLPTLPALGAELAADEPIGTHIGCHKFLHKWLFLIAWHTRHEQERLLVRAKDSEQGNIMTVIIRTPSDGAAVTGGSGRFKRPVGERPPHSCHDLFQTGAFAGGVGWIKNRAEIGGKPIPGRPVSVESQ